MMTAPTATSSQLVYPGWCESGQISRGPPAVADCVVAPPLAAGPLWPEEIPTGATVEAAFRAGSRVPSVGSDARQPGVHDVRRRYRRYRRVRPRRRPPLIGELAPS